MFKKKKEIIKDTIEDMRLNQLRVQIADISYNMYKTIEDIIVKQGVINLYLDGADKDKAIKDYRFKQRQLLALIGEYDDLRNQIDNYMKKTKEKRKTTLDYKLHVTSHERIEQIYKATKGM